MGSGAELTGSRSATLAGVRCLLASVRYSPGLAKEVCAFAQQLRNRGATVQLLLSGEYASSLFPSEIQLAYLGRSTRYWQVVMSSFRRSFRSRIAAIVTEFQPHFVMVYNPHPANVCILRLGAAQSSRALTCVFLHAPYTPRKWIYGWKALELIAVEWLQKRSLRFAEVVILPSSEAERRFHLRYPDMRVEIRRSNLIVPDDAPRPNPAPAREFFTLLGHVNKVTGLGDFLRLAKACHVRGLPYKFQVITASDVRKYARWAGRHGLENLRIQSGRVLSDEEIDGALQGSLAAFRSGRDMIQSGVIPVAFKNDTPVIAPDLPGYSQHIRDRVDGCLFSPEAPIEDLLEPLDWIMKNPTANANARRSYEENFSPEAWGGMYGWLVERLRRYRTVSPQREGNLSVR